MTKSKKDYPPESQTTMTPTVSKFTVLFKSISITLPTIAPVRKSVEKLKVAWTQKESPQRKRSQVAAKTKVLWSEIAIRGGNDA